MTGKLDELAEASVGQRVATFLLAGCFAPLFGGAAVAIVGKIEDPVEEVFELGGAALMGMISVMVALVAAIAIRPSLARHKGMTVAFGAFFLIVLAVFRVFVN
ncbi:MAG: hypothetical protein GY913_05100 [Proteobacteria bacterium]|nr:hypothetical protein [Pseudomonadota bacterium]MCP4916278.1 hypothetical protein [Pseudomonadota bacterium]